MALSDYQLSFGGLTMGAGTAYPFIEIDGLEEFTARSTDVQMPNAYGALAGPAWVEERFVTAVIEVLGGAPVIHALEAVLQPNSVSPDALATLGIKLPDQEELAIQARVDRRSRPLNNLSEYGRVEMTVMFAVPDPRKYSATFYTAAMAAYVSTMNGITMTAGSGVNLGIDLTLGTGTNLGLDFPANTTVGDFTLTNAGTTATYPTFTITSTGVATTYNLTNFTTGDIVSLSQVIGPADTVVADMEAFVTGVGIPILYNGTSKYSVWTSPRNALKLVPGANTVRLTVTSGSTSTTASAVWQNAYL